MGRFERPSSGRVQAGSLPEIRTNDTLGLEWVGIISPQMVLNARVSFSRYLGEDRGDANAGFDITKLGFPSSLATSLPGGAFFGTYSFYQLLQPGPISHRRYHQHGLHRRQPELERARAFHQGRRGFARYPVRYAKLQHRSQPERGPGLDAAKLRPIRPSQRQQHRLLAAGHAEQRQFRLQLAGRVSGTPTTPPGFRMTGGSASG